MDISGEEVTEQVIKKDVNLPELFAVTTGADPKPVYRPPWLGGRLLKIKIQTKCNQIKSSVSL